MLRQRVAKGAGKSCSTSACWWLAMHDWSSWSFQAWRRCRQTRCMDRLYVNTRDEVGDVQEVIRAPDIGILLSAGDKTHQDLQFPCFQTLVGRTSWNHSRIQLESDCSAWVAISLPRWAPVFRRPQRRYVWRAWSWLLGLHIWLDVRTNPAPQWLRTHPLGRLHLTPASPMCQIGPFHQLAAVPFFLMWLKTIHL